MEMFLLMILIIMSAIAITYYKEIYLYVCLTLGSMIQSVTDKINAKTKAKKKRGK